MYFRKVQRININKVIWLLTVADIFNWGVYYTIISFTGLYLAQKLNTNVVEIIGIGLALYNLSRAIAQIPAGIISDRLKGDSDDIRILVMGTLMIGLGFLCFPLISSPAHFYALQILQGTGAAIAIVTWRKLFAKNLDKGEEGAEYAIYDTIISLAVVIMGIAAGFVANLSSTAFDLVMFTVGLLIIFSSFISSMIFRVKYRNSNEL
jgi:MFS family permease